MASEKSGTKDIPTSDNPAIPRVGKHRMGYDTEQVDAFLEHSHELYDSPEPQLTQEEIQNASFAMRKNGYSISQVDAVLTRLESAVVDKRTQWDVEHYGRVAWRARTDTLARSLHDRAARPHGERFAPGAKGRPSYDRKQVDHVVDCLIIQIARRLGSTEGIAVEGAEEPKKWRSDPDVWSMTDVANVIFTQRSGKHGYDERQVDAYLKRVLQVLARIESFERIVGPVAATDGTADAGDTVVTTPVTTPAQDKPTEATGSPATATTPPEAAETVVLHPLDDPDLVVESAEPQETRVPESPAPPASPAPATETGTFEADETRSFTPLVVASDDTMDDILPPLAPQPGSPAAKVIDADTASVASDDTTDNTTDNTTDDTASAANSAIKTATVLDTSSLESDDWVIDSTPVAPRPADATVQKMTFAEAKHSSERASSSLASLVSTDMASTSTAATPAVTPVSPALPSIDLPAVPQLHHVDLDEETHGDTEDKGK